MLTSTLDGNGRVSLVLRPLYPTSGGKTVLRWGGWFAPKRSLWGKQKNHAPPSETKTELSST